MSNSIDIDKLPQDEIDKMAELSLRRMLNDLSKISPDYKKAIICLCSEVIHLSGDLKFVSSSITMPQIQTLPNPQQEAEISE